MVDDMVTTEACYDCKISCDINVLDLGLIDPLIEFDPSVILSIYVVVNLEINRCDNKPVCNNRQRALQA